LFTSHYRHTVWQRDLRLRTYAKLPYSVETTYGINSVISKLMTFVENAETGQFLFLIVVILSWFTCSWRHPFLSYNVISNFFKWQSPLFSSVFDRPSYYLNDRRKKLLAYLPIFLWKRQILIQKLNLIFYENFNWPQTKTTKYLKLTIKCDENVEIVPCIWHSPTLCTLRSIMSRLICSISA
jgi:hypothetical protein